MSNEKWTTADMPSLAGKRVVVTGGNSGVGYEAAKAFAEKGAHTILACRNLDKGSAALTTLKRKVPNANAEVMQLDLASLASVRAFGDAFNATYDSLDLLINNAGIMMVPYGTTEDGFERQFGTNHLGHFALTGLLLDALNNSESARIVNVSSLAHARGTMDFDDLMYADGAGYEPMDAYGRSKLANLLFTYELERRLKSAESAIISIAVHPGISSTNLANHMFDKWYYKPLAPIVKLMFQAPSKGALPTIRAASDPAAQGGTYYGPNGRGERSGSPVIVKSNSASHNEEDAQKLWSASEELTGVRYLSG